MNTVFIKYKVIRGVFALLGSLPPFLQRLLARCLGLAAYAADKKHRRIVTENLSLAYGREKTPEEIRRLAREVFIHFSRVIFEIGWLSRISLRRFAACCRVEGVENYRRALAENRGVFLLTGHIGNWELFAAATAGIIDHPGFVYRPLASPPLELFFREQRSRTGAVMFVKKLSMRHVLRHIREKGTVVVMLDQHAKWKRGVFVDFFGRPVGTNKGLALMALRTEVPVVPVYLVRENNHFLLRFEPALPLIKTGDKTFDVEENTRQYNEALEAIIRRYPEQWFWLHRRWKRRNYCLLSERPPQYKPSASP